MKRRRRRSHNNNNNNNELRVKGTHVEKREYYLC
jgi:hypothetical protein